MENAMVRPRYVKRPVQNKHRRKAPGAGGGIKRIIARQFLICALLLIIVCIVKSTNFSATNFITDKVKYVISYDVELKSVFAYMGKLASEVKESISPANSVSAKQTSNTAQTPGVAQTSNTTQTSSATQTSSVTQTSIETQASGMDQAALPVLAGNTATLSSSESIQGNNEVQKHEDKTMEASSSIENASDQYETEDEVATMPETSVLSATSGIEQQNPFDMMLPVEGTLISQFGEKSSDAAGSDKTHKGIDIAVGRGVPIKTVLDGKVSDTGSSPVYGSYIRIMHENGLQTIYANCSSIIAKKNDIVKKGDVIAEIGGTGTASVGIHLHFEVWKDSLAVDPLEYISVPAR
jgi:murein DD-endopeptidase MepM/ murein hydrolase activator NlpD